MAHLPPVSRDLHDGKGRIREFRDPGSWPLPRRGRGACEQSERIRGYSAAGSGSTRPEPFFSPLDATPGGRKRALRGTASGGTGKGPAGSQKAPEEGSN